MTTQAVQSPNPTSARAMLETVRDVLDWVRETPAPHWEGDAADKATFVGYVGASMVTWTVLGLLVAAGLGRLLSLVA